LKNLNEKKLHELIPGTYAQFWNCCESKNGYSGTAIFTKVKPLDVSFNFSKKHDSEGR
jgi:exodeoxyribonuclease-3